MKKIFLLLIVAVALWFYSGPVRTVPGVYNSPDEQVTAVFLARYTNTNTLRLPHPFSVGSEDEFLHPRSAFADFGSYALPVGFWGLIIVYGSLAQFFSLTAAPYFTLLLVVLMATAWKRLSQIIFPGISSLAVFLLTLFHPAVWYYAARPFLPNLPFLCFLVIGLVWLITRPLTTLPTKKLPGATTLDDIVGAGLIGVALLVRPNELWWVIGVMSIIIIAYWREITRTQLIIWGVVAVIMFIIFSIVNKMWFGAVAGGYVVSRSLPLAHWWNVVFPFGIHPRSMVASAYTYGLSLWPWLIIPAVGTIGYLLAKKRTTLSKPIQVYVFITIWVSIFLWLYYGSWQDATFTIKTIGVAYVRYWLPIFLLLIPFTVLALQWLTSRIRWPRFAFVILIGAVLLTNTWAVLHGPDGITNLTIGLKSGQIIREQVITRTHEQAIVVTERHDKFVWPTRQVMVRLENPRVQEAVRQLVSRKWPVYTLCLTDLVAYWCLELQPRFRDSLMA